MARLFLGAGIGAMLAWALAAFLPSVVLWGCGRGGRYDDDEIAEGGRGNSSSSDTSGTDEGTDEGTASSDDEATEEQASGGAGSSLQYEDITVFEKITIFGTDVFDPDDGKTDFGWYDSEADCLAGKSAEKEPEDAWQFDGVIDVCATKGEECYPGKIVSKKDGTGSDASLKFIATEDSIEMKVYLSDECGSGSFTDFNKAVGTTTFAGEKRKEFLSGRCVPAEVGIAGLAGTERWGHLEITKTCNGRRLRSLFR